MEIGTALVWLTLGVLVYFVLSTLRVILSSSKPVIVPQNDAALVGDITMEELSKYSGLDPYRPILFAVRGAVYDVTSAREFYGPGRAYSVFAGREVARALGKMAIDAAQCSGDISDLTEKEHGVLRDWEEKFQKKYKVVGQVVPLRRLTLSQLAGHDGNDPEAPILLSVRGLVFDVTRGRDFYGRDGAYPFGGKECARALAKFSTELEDCTGDLEGCSLAEMDALRDWEARFHAKYPIVGKLVEESSGEDTAALWA